jgi:hypothetical protein
MATDAFTSGSSWSWPKPEATTTSSFEDVPIPGTFKSEEFDQEDPSEAPGAEPDKADEGKQAPGPTPHTRRSYHPRTCRICLEVVLPTFEPASEALPGFLHPEPKVTYMSQEPESGRLIRPCKCKGSQRYVHEGCLQDWRHADPAYRAQNYWECPTCKFRYRLERMKWSRWISSTTAQIGLTVLILFTTVFILGFVADPIIGLYVDPLGTLTTNPLSSPVFDTPDLEDEGWTFGEHLMKGLASLGLLGVVKAFFAMGPWQWYNLRNTGLLNGGGGRRGRGNAGRDRLANISWSLVIIGVMTFLYAVWKAVRAWSRRTLEKAGERVADVQGEDDNDEENGEDDPTSQATAGNSTE